jgi:DNA (cytosine-5)-methyltransferase 1
MAKRKITQLDLFSGIGGFHLGFERAGYVVESYFSEIDKHAVAVYKHRFKNSTYVGSVTDVRGAELPRIDLITFGSPCQDFSLAGKRKGMQGDRSSLVLEAIRLINECRPSVFIWENVKGTFSSNAGADFWAIIQAFANIGGYRLEWQLLNTSWVLPQNRERVYVVGYSTTPGGDWRGVFPIGEETGEPSKIIQTAGLTGGQLGRVLDPKGIGYALSACDYKDPMKVEVKSATSKGYEEATDIRGNEQIATIRSGGRGRYQEDGSIKQELEINKEGKSNTLTAVQKDNMVVEPNYRIRRLTPIECERLQGFPDNHTEYGNYDGEVKKMSNTQRYKQCGNAVTVDIVALVAEAVKPLFK